MRRVSAVLLALVVAASGVPAARAAMTQSPSGIDERLHFEWEAGQTRGGAPVIAGYLYNDYRRVATNVVVAAETLDAAGQVTRRSLTVLPGIVPAFSRAYFEVRPASPGSTYRLVVTSFEWYAGGAN